MTASRACSRLRSLPCRRKHLQAALREYPALLIAARGLVASLHRTIVPHAGHQTRTALERRDQPRPRPFVAPRSIKSSRFTPPEFMEQIVFRAVSARWRHIAMRKLSFHWKNLRL